MVTSHLASDIRYEVHGHGIPLVLGYPIKASSTPEDPDRAVLTGYLARLTDRYRVLVMDYPQPLPPVAEFTAQRVCSDLLAVADAAGFDRFVWWGFSWGGLIGLQLASRSNRVAALVCGGWSPLGGAYADMLRAMRTLAANSPPTPGMDLNRFVTFYESVQDWPEAEAVGRIKCPRMAFVGSADELEIGGVSLRLAATIHERRRELEELGWHVAEIAGRDHSVYTDPTIVAPIVREFLDKAI